MERLKIKKVLQRVEGDATPRSVVGSVLIGISSDVKPSGDRIAVLDAEQVEEKVDLIAARRTKKNP